MGGSGDIDEEEEVDDNGDDKGRYIQRNEVGKMQRSRGGDYDRDDKKSDENMLM